MASLVRQRKTYFVNAAGRRVPPNTPGATKVTKESAKWYGQGVPGWPKGKRVPLATNRRVAEKMLADLVSDAERGRVGIPTADLSRARLLDLIPEFEAAMGLGLASKNRAATKKPSPAQVTLNSGRVQELLAGCRFVTAADLNDAAPAALARYLAGRLALPRRDGGLSAQTAEFYRKAAKRFAWWLAVRKKAPVRADLFDDVAGFDPKHRRVHARRTCSPADLAALLDATRNAAGDYRGLLGEDRYFVYLVAFASGFRAGELAVLAPTNFALDHDPPLVVLGAHQTKNGKAARQPLPPAVAAQLRAYLSGRPAELPIWAGTWAEKPVKMLRADLKRAGVAYKVDTPDGPRYLDFHALRHSFVSALAAAGVGPKELQTLARHSDAQTTLNVYTHVGAGALGEAVARLPLPGADPNPLAALTRGELEAAVIGMAAMLRTLLSPGEVPGPQVGPKVAPAAVVTPRVTPPVAPGGDSVGRRGTTTRKKSAG